MALINLCRISAVIGIRPSTELHRFFAPVGSDQPDILCTNDTAEIIVLGANLHDVRWATNVAIILESTGPADQM